jgi:hypothetical protein
MPRTIKPKLPKLLERKLSKTGSVHPAPKIPRCTPRSQKAPPHPLTSPGDFPPGYSESPCPARDCSLDSISPMAD